MKLALAALAAAALVTACGQKKGRVYFANLQDGAEVESPFTVEMRADDLVVEPAANGVNKGRGHFHILIDTPLPRSNDPLEVSPNHLDFAGGETEAVLDLPEGDHTLILQFASGDHRPYRPETSQEIRIRVTRQNMPMPDDMWDLEGGMMGDTLGMDSAFRAQDSLLNLRGTGPGTGSGAGPGTGTGTGTGTAPSGSY